MSARGDALAEDVLSLVARSSPLIKAAGGAAAAVVERSVAETVIRELCRSIGRFEEHSDYVTMMLRAMSQPPGAIIPGPGPGRHQEPYEPDEWRMMRVRAGERG